MQNDYDDKIRPYFSLRGGFGRGSYDKVTNRDIAGREVENSNLLPAYIIIYYLERRL
jgi:hypothetical protein